MCRFELADGGRSVVNLTKARWIEQSRDPRLYEITKGGPPVIHDPRMPLLRVPLADYVGGFMCSPVADAIPPRRRILPCRAGRFGTTIKSFSIASPARRRATANRATFINVRRALDRGIRPGSAAFCRDRADQGSTGSHAASPIRAVFGSPRSAPVGRENRGH